MVNPRQRRKSKAAAHKKTRPSRHVQRNLRKMKPIRGPKVLQEAWDKKKTVKQNYAALGLANSLKIADSGGTEKLIYPQPAETSTGDSSQSHLEGSSKPEVSQSFGRIIRDESGRIIDFQLIESDESNPIEISGAESNQKKSQEEALQASNGEVIEALEKLAQTSCPVQRHTSETETAALKRLIAKHGHDFNAMAKDIRLNRWQRTSGELRRACKKAGLV